MENAGLRRDVDQMADEIAQLHHERDALEDRIIDLERELAESQARHPTSTRRLR
jgi:cell division protein FtsB